MSAVEAGERRRIESAGLLTGAALLTVGLAAVWPAAAVLFAGLVAVAWTSAYNPRLALFLAIGLFSIEGSLKIAFTAWGSPVDGDPREMTAVFLDLALAVAIVGVLLEDRWTTPRAVWEASGRLEKAAFIALAVWLVVSIPQIFVGDVGNGLRGFRLTQGYVVLALVGAILAREPGKVVRPLLWLSAAICGYAVARLITGPLDVEIGFVSSHDPAAIFYATGDPDTFRVVGSFQSAVGLASFATPAFVFAAVIALEDRDNRGLALLTAALAGTAVFASYVRVALLAVVLALLLALIIGRTLRGRGSHWRTGLAVGAVGLAVFGVGLLAARGVPYAQDRFEGFFNPAEDESLDIRFETWERSIDKFADQPLGLGLGQIGHAGAGGSQGEVVTDNSFLKVLVEQGVEGFIAYVVGIVGLCLLCALRLRRGPPSPLGVAALCGFVCFLLLGMAGEYVEQPGKALAWLLLGVGVSCAYGLGREPAEPRAPVQAAGRSPGWNKHGRAIAAGLVLLLGIVAVAAVASRESGYVATVEAFPSDGDSATQVSLDRWRKIAARDDFVDATLAQLPAQVSSGDVRAATLEFLASSPFAFEIAAGTGTPMRASLLATEIGEQLESFSVGLDASNPTVALGPASVPAISGTVDEAIDAVPGPFPPRPAPFWVALITILAASATWLLWPRAVEHRGVGGRSVLGLLATSARSRVGLGAPAVALFALACVGAVILLLVLGHDLTFFNDEWSLILTRGDSSADALFAPVNEHLFAGQILLYKLMLPIFGMESTVAYHVVTALLVVTIAVLGFVHVRRRLGDWPALLAGSLILFLGPAWESILWPGGIGFMASLAAGLGALLALEREDARGDRWACALLVVSLLNATLGLMYAFGAAVDVALRGPWRRRIFVPLVPVAVYGAWYLGWGHEAESAASLHNLLTTPTYVVDAAAAVLATMFGLSSEGLDWGRPLLIAALIGVGWYASRNPRVASRRLWVLLAIAVSFWALAGLNEIVGRPPGASRYQMLGLVPVLLILAEVLRDAVIDRRALLIATLVTGAAIAGNLVALKDGEHFLRGESDTLIAELSALELARPHVNPGFNLGRDVPDAGYAGAITAGPFFEAIDDWGSPVEPEADLAESTEDNRAQADRVFAAALGVGLEPVALPEEVGRRDCETLQPAGGEALVVAELPRGGAILLPDGGPVTVSLRRYTATAFPIAVGTVSEPTFLAVPVDESSAPWVAAIEGPGPTDLCPRQPGALTAG